MTTHKKQRQKVSIVGHGGAPATGPFADFANKIGEAYAALHMPPPEANYVRLRSLTDKKLVLVAELGEEGATASGRLPSYDVLSRPTASTPSGAPPLTIKIPMLLDGWRKQRSIEDGLTLLERLQGMDERESPEIVVEGLAVPHSLSKDAWRRWNLSGDTEWGEVRWLPNGARCYAQFAVTVVERVNAPFMPDPTSTKRSTFVVQKKSPLNTIRRIAKAHGMSVKALMRLNPDHRDSDRKLKAGHRVRVM